MEFDFKKPDYTAEFQRRAENLKRIRENTGSIIALRSYYKENIADFICDWGMTADPRNAEIGLPVVVPFILFERQREFVDWLISRWKGQEDGLVEKSRDMGLSWLSVAVSCSLCIFYKDLSIGFGSRKEEYVDSSGDPKSLFYKARQFMNLLPTEFKGGWSESKNSKHMLISFPSGSALSGESGDSIGRGNRTSLYLKDESAFYARPERIDAALSQTSNCKIDISTVNGTGNPFYRKRFSGKIPVFVFDWREDPRKDQAWYDAQAEKEDPKTVAQEIDRDYMASVESVCIPGKHVSAAINLHLRLDLQPSGIPRVGLDVADEEGRDMNVVIAGIGTVITEIEGWKGLDTTQTAMKANSFARDNRAHYIAYDSIGVGAGVRGASKTLAVDFYGVATSSKDLRGTVPGNTDLLRKDYYANLRIQLWWELRLRFERAYQHVKGIKVWSLDEMISIPNHSELITELSQPTYFYNEGSGKLQLESKKDMAKRGVMSPNYADSLALYFAPIEKQRRKAAVYTAQTLGNRRAVYE